MSEEEKAALQKVTDRFNFKCNSYYLSLINFDDPNDPLRQVVIPRTEELEDWGDLDPSDEKKYTVMPGVEHKYDSVVLFLVTNQCDSICRYCFRKRIFVEPQKDHIHDWQAAYKYVSDHPNVTNVLLTGGDVLMLSNSKLKNILGRLRDIDHVQIIRIGTRMNSYNPYSIIDNPALLKTIEKYSTNEKKIYIMTHFIHPNELTDTAIESVNLLRNANAELANQTPLIRGVNDNAEVLAELLKKLSFIGDPPHYIFQCRPTTGNKCYTVPIEEGYEIVEQAKSLVSGLAKSVRYVMSHASGKLEIIGKANGKVYFKYHRAYKNEDSGRLMIFKSNPEACWLDDYDEARQIITIS